MGDDPNRLIGIGVRLSRGLDKRAGEQQTRANKLQEPNSHRCLHHLRSLSCAHAASGHVSAPPPSVTIPRLSTAKAEALSRPGLIESKDIAEAGFIYGLPIVMNYAVM